MGQTPKIAARASYFAIDRPDLTIAMSLLQYSGIDVDIKMVGSGRTALMLASAINVVNAVKLLVEHPGVSVNIKDNNGQQGGGNG